MSEWNLSVRLTGEGSNLARSLRETARDARAAGRDVDSLRRSITALRADARRDIRLRVRVDADRLIDARGLRRDVTDAVNRAQRGQRIRIPIVLGDPARLRRDVNAAIRRAEGQTVRVRVVADTSDLNQIRRTLGGGPGGGSMGGGGGLRGLMLLAPAAIPLAAGLSTALAPLPGLFAAGGVAAGAFGAAIAGQVGPLSEVADAEKKYRDAVRENGAASAEAAKAQVAYQRALAALPPDTQRAAIALGQLKGNFSGWSRDMAQFTMTPLTHGITVLDQIIPRLTPEVKSASTQLDRLVTVAGGAVATPGFDAMADRFANFTDRQLDEMTDKVMHFLRLLTEGKGITSGPLAEFVAYAKENGPGAREALKAISDAIVTLLRASADAGPTMLTLVTAAARLVAALPPELVGIILQVATALKLLQLTGAGMAALAGGLARVRTAIVGLSTASAAAGGGLAGLQAAFASLGTAAKASIVVAGIAAVALVLSNLSETGKEAPPNVDRLTTSLGKLGQTGKVTGELARSFGKDLSGLGDSLRTLSRPSNLDKTQQWLTQLIGMDSTPVKDAKERFDALDEGLTSLVKDGKAGLAKAALEDTIAALRKQGYTADEVTSQLDGYKSALADQAFEQELAAQAMGVFGKAAQDTQLKLDAQKQSAEGLRQSIMALNDVNRSAYDAQISFEQAVDDLTASFKENGASLDISTEAGRKNGQAMSTAAKSQDEMIAAGLAAGESLESMTSKSSQLRGEMMRLATEAFGGNTKKAREYVNTLLGTPGQIKTMIKLERQEALEGLRSVQAEIKKTPGAKTITVDTLNAAAIAALEAVGLKTKQLPNGRTAVYTANGQALGSISAVANALSRLDGQSATTYVNSIVTTTKKSVHEVVGKADGGVLDFYANGGIQRGGLRSFAGGSEQHVAQIAPGGSWRVWGEPETQGEGYVPFARSKRVRSRAITEEIVRRLGGDPMGIQWNADGNVTDWRYDPTTGSLYSASDAGQAGHKTRKVKVKGKGGKVSTKEVEYFDLAAVEKRIKSTAKATQAWNADLGKVADRVGGDVAEALAAMGEDGMKLAHKMATGSTRYINDMAKALRNLQKTAKASLTDYTRQLSNANKVNKDFADDLAKLAAMGYGDLASQLAAQNDTAAQQLADAATRDRKKAADANAKVKAANNALTSEQVTELVQIIAAISSKTTGIHDVAAKTGLGEDEIIAVANKAKGQISSSLGSRSTRFLADLGRANKHLSYADGGIRAGMYATQGGIVRFAEPETHGEAYLPLSPSKRRSALPVLADVAHRFGVGLTDASASRPVVVVRDGDTTNVSVTAVRTGASASDIGSQVGRSVRRARRGGVASRAA